jgi:hypothetical protein
MLPVRKIRPSSRSITGKRPSRKNSLIHAFESALARDHTCLLEYDDDVEKHIVQPVTIQYGHESKNRRYTPDVMVYYKSYLNKPPLLCEVKYEAELAAKAEEYKPRFQAAREHCDIHSMEFRVVTETTIRAPLLDNITFISQYLRGQADKVLSHSITKCFDSCQKLTPLNILSAFAEHVRPTALYALWCLVAEKQLCCDMQQKITIILCYG